MLRLLTFLLLLSAPVTALAQPPDDVPTPGGPQLPDLLASTCLAADITAGPSGLLCHRPGRSDDLYITFFGGGGAVGSDDAAVDVPDCDTIVVDNVPYGMLRALTNSKVTGQRGRFGPITCDYIPAPLPPTASGSSASSIDTTYFQFGAFPSQADIAYFGTTAFGGSTQIQATNTQAVLNGGLHYMWMAAGLVRPGQGDIFMQIGYSVTTMGSNIVPFIFVNHSSMTGGTWVFKFFPQYPLFNGAFYTFWFENDGVRLSDNGYNWTFNLNGTGYSNLRFYNLHLETPYMRAPYLTSEVAGSYNPCADTLQVTYGSGGTNQTQSYALRAKKAQGLWSTIQHATATYGFAQCQNGNVYGAAGLNRAITVLTSKTTRTTCMGCSVW